MTVFQAIILGIVQGLTEFLPVSSSGHLVLLQNIMGIEGEMLFFDTMLHVGTLVAVCFLFFKDIKSILCHPIQKLTGTLIVATVPAVVATLLFGNFFEGAYSGAYLGFGFLLTAVILTFTELISATMSSPKKSVSYPNSLVVGCMQAVAILPGISRSGSTIAGGLLCNIDRRLAARFSFLMTIPAILGSVVYQGYDMVRHGAGEIFVLPTILGMLCAMVSGFFAIRFMLRLITKKKLYGFAIYCGILGAFVLLDQLALHLIFQNPFVG